MKPAPSEETIDRSGDPPELFWGRPSVRAGVAAIVVFLVISSPTLRSVLRELSIALTILGVLAIGAWLAGRIGVSSQAPWGSRGVWAGVGAIVVSLIMGAPWLGGGVLGELRFLLTALGLLAIAAGMTAMLRHLAWPDAVKAAAVVATVFAIGTLVLSGVDQVPFWPERCANAETALTLENPGPVYCHEYDGTLVRMTIGNVRQCPDGSVIWDTTTLRRSGSGWWAEMPGRGCPL
jgi:hypothetical protein